MKIIIVGAGPVGCYTAQLLKQKGYETVLLEEHSSVGKPVQCAGIVSSKLISSVEPFISRQAIVNKINRFVISTPWTEEFSVDIPGVGCIVNREQFDLDLGEGLDIRLKRRVAKIEKEDNGYCVNTEIGEKFRSDILIGADGPDSIVRDFMLNDSFSKIKNINSVKIKYYFGMQYQVRLDNIYQEISSDSIQVFFDDNIPFFLWVISENRETLRIGVVAKVAKNAKEILDKYLIRKNIKGKIIDIITGKISLGYIPSCNNNIALVGDAACQVKPLTGGGLSFGIQSARILADCIEYNKLEEYDQRWKKKFGKEIKFGLKARKIYEELDSTKKEQVFLLFKKNSDFIEQAAEFDNHSRLFKEAFKNPQLLIDAGKVLRYYLEDMLK
jgi:digeranylgeranylglycerophospholipid reductase